MGARAVHVAIFGSEAPACASLAAQLTAARPDLNIHSLVNPPLHSPGVGAAAMSDKRPSDTTPHQEASTLLLLLASSGPHTPLRDALLARNAEFTTLHGDAWACLAQAVQAVDWHMRRAAPRHSAPTASAARWKWNCACCNDAASEAADFRRLLNARR